MCLLILKPCGFMKNLFCIHEVTALDLFLKTRENQGRENSYVYVMKRDFSILLPSLAQLLFLLFFFCSKATFSSILIKNDNYLRVQGE